MGEAAHPMRGALDGVRVVDFTQMMLGPWATQFLGDMGADIVKIERPGSGEWERGLAAMGQLLGGDSPFFLAMNRNKRSLTLDLKAPEAQEIVRELVRRGDVVVENFRPGVLDRLGLGYDALRAINPRIIYAAGYGYGSSGPYLRRPGQDLLIQAMSGYAAQNGRAGEAPVPSACSVMDASTALMLALSITTALYCRERTGIGQRVEVSLFNTALAIQCQELLAHFNLPVQGRRSEAGIGAPWLAAPFGIYAASDGYVAISINPLTEIAEALGLPELHRYADEASAYRERDTVRRILDAAVAARRADDVVAALAARDLWCARVQDFDAVLRDPQVAHNGMIQEIEHPTAGRMKVIGIPVSFSETPGAIRLVPPRVGEHTDAVLEELGYDPARRAELRARAII
ncbi:MAG TPA: CoA transferase [Acetobacteraceae bacterium]|nr:CoA transferase [Acetobacteraceae bacterium]